MIAQLLAWLLWQANADPPITRRREFYAVKERILRRHGEYVGNDLQHIRKPCWGSVGEGCHQHCKKCAGTGVFDEFWVLLQRWSLGRYTFHIPSGERLWQRPMARPTIEGYVRHAERDHGLSHEAALWLFLFYDFKTFWRLLRMMRGGSPGWMPLSRVQYVVFEVRMFLGRLKVRRCMDCGRWTVQWINGWVFALRCRACAYAEQRRWERVGQEPPF